MSSSMTMVMSSMVSTTGSAAAAATSSAAADSHDSHSSDMSMGGGCQISMLWNWQTIDSCFLAESWHIRNNGMFAASCIGVALLVVCLEFVRRLTKEYDDMILRQFRRNVALRAAELKGQKNSDSCCTSQQFVVFRASPLQQLIRALLHAVVFAIAYIVMLLAMYYNGFILISIFIGAFLGKFICDWMVQKIPLGDDHENPRAPYIKEASVCCG